MRIPGIDVSAYQGEIDWTQVSGTGIQFAIIRAGVGRLFDVRYLDNIQQAYDNGIQIGLYWFSYAINASEAREEAERILEASSVRPLAYPLAFDFEESSVQYAVAHGIQVTREFVTEITHAFCSTIADAGYKPMVYSNSDFLRQYLDLDALDSNCRLWLAEWGTSYPSRQADIWQYSQNGRIDGIRTTVDLDFALTNCACSSVRYQTLEEFPESLRVEAKKLIDSGALKGTGNQYNVTEDMLRSMIVSMRYTDEQLKKLRQKEF